MYAAVCCHTAGPQACGARRGWARASRLSQCLQGLLAQLLAKHSQGGAFSVCQRYTAMELVTQDAVFRSQVCVAQAQFLIHRSRDMRKELLPIHGSFHPSCCLSLVGSMGHTEMECKMRSEWWEDGKEWENGMF